MSLKFCKLTEVASPKRANPGDAGIDFFIPTDWNSGDLRVVRPQESVLIPLGIKVDVPFGYALVLFNKSGISTQTGLVAGACVIDHGYQGQIHCHLINSSDKNVEIKPGQKIIQGLLLPIELISVEQVDESELFPTNSDRGTGGFGSTGQ